MSLLWGTLAPMRLVELDLNSAYGACVGEPSGGPSPGGYLSGTIIRGTLKTPNSQLVTPISIKLQRPDGYD
jgi:hypothetical protein